MENEPQEELSTAEETNPLDEAWKALAAAARAVKKRPDKRAIEALVDASLEYQRAYVAEFTP